MQFDSEEQRQLSEMIEHEAGFAEHIQALQQPGNDMPTEFEQIGSDRVAEFEEETARTRQSAREDVAKGSTEQSETEGLKCALSGHEDRNQPPERRKEAQHGGVDVVLQNPEQEATPLRMQASWVSDAVCACQANKKVRITVLPFRSTC